VRVVGGTARGKTLALVPGKGTRPILDRVKTALFDILRPRLDGARVLDLFAGSGSVGIEALSQGATHCTFLDLSRNAIATIRKNLETTGLLGAADVFQRNALEYLKAANGPFDLIYIAPPQYQDLWIEALRALDARPELLTSAEGDDTVSGLAIVQIDPREYQDSLELASLEEVRQKRYGNTLLVFYERALADPQQPTDDRAP
jgi:16S rRNA (guanine(966)-N(2))-methyltransferase RsmD